MSYNSTSDLGIFALEQRIMFDGAMAVDAVDASGDDKNDAEPDHAQTHQKRDVVVVDASVKNHQSILDEANTDADVIVLSSGDTLETLADRLSGYSDLSSLHILSHGGDGYILLGGETINQESLTENSDILSRIGESLSASGDILLYGCNVGENLAGQSFVQQFAELTNADVAASDDITGGVHLGGDWDLEVNSGEIETAALAAKNYNDVLGLPGARSHTTAGGNGTTAGEVILGGNYLELGITGGGTFGTVSELADINAESGSTFFGASGVTRVGMSADADGFDTGTDLRIDYFVPGTPYEAWGIGYTLSSVQTSGENTTVGTHTDARGYTNDISVTSVTNTSSGDTLSARIIGELGGNLRATIDISFEVNDKNYTATVQLENIGAGTLENVRYSREFDPDNTNSFPGVGASGYTTTNTIVQTHAAGDGRAIVTATSASGDAYATAAGSTSTVLFSSTDSSARVGYGNGTSNDNLSADGVYKANLYDSAPAKGSTATQDKSISITFDVGSLATGESKSVSYSTGLDNRGAEAITGSSSETTTETTAEEIFAPPPDVVDAPIDGPLGPPVTVLADPVFDGDAGPAGFGPVGDGLGGDGFRTIINSDAGGDGLGADGVRTFISASNVGDGLGADGFRTILNPSDAGPQGGAVGASIDGGLGDGGFADGGTGFGDAGGLGGFGGFAPQGTDAGFDGGNGPLGDGGLLGLEGEELEGQQLPGQGDGAVQQPAPAQTPQQQSQFKGRPGLSAQLAKISVGTIERDFSTL